MPEISLSILSFIGIGGIVSAFFTYFWQKRKEVQLKENELKERRYLCTLLLMYAYIRPQELTSLRRMRPEIQNQDDLKRELQTEWVNSWIFAGDKTIMSFKRFIENPNQENFAKTVLAMRKDLWNKKSKLSLQTFTIEGFPT